MDFSLPPLLLTSLLSKPRGSGPAGVKADTSEALMTSLILLRCDIIPSTDFCSDSKFRKGTRNLSLVLFWSFSLIVKFLLPDLLPLILPLYGSEIASANDFKKLIFQFGNICYKIYEFKNPISTEFTLPAHRTLYYRLRMCVQTH